MYFWNIKKVREGLASGAISERTGFKYFMAHVVLYSLTYVLFVEARPTDYIVGMLSMVIIIGGILYAHHSNGGYEGENFYTRLFAIGWVMTIKLFALFVVLFLLLSFLEGVASNVDTSSFLYTEAALLILFELIYYWRVSVHMRRTNALVAVDPDAQ